ncbi:hypothetical protein [Bacillus atrophaeus]|uniref:hypothetical protein n=1 Tax=Bacillus atrophaeus TaxID=1452 RepID=UPI002E21CE61|nr:hypothetical protein [Bacillus atrophaeus]MED1029632.1 hypothetical protein [Bacillus atrophaeus]MED1117652.1 hypothetical protein [Bacillus atrophaeus]MED1131424.1 hypothetical protein [Bacillus atrophaeus]
MSLPNIPNITPDISLTRCETLNLLLSSVAMEEIGLSAILQAEAEKIQTCLSAENHPPFHELLEMNRSVERLLRTVMKSQLLLQTKLEDIIYLQESESCIDPEDPDDPDDPDDPEDPNDPDDPEDPEDPDDPNDPCEPYHPEPPHRHDPCDDLFYGRIDCCECEECEECEECDDKSDSIQGER